MYDIGTPEGHDTGARHVTVRQRHAEMIRLVRETGFATIQSLAEHFRITPQSVRRDINTLSAKGLLRRYHGGAAPCMTSENMDYMDRKVLCLAEKRVIGRMVAKAVPDKSSLFINIGTTTEEVARAMAGHKNLRVITNSLNVATILTGNPEVEIIVAGGLIRHHDGGIVGEAAIDFIRQFKVDFGIIGISGIDMDGTLLDFDYREVRAARAIMENSRKVFLVTDHTKFGRNAMVRLGNIEEIHALFTGRMPPASVLERMKLGGVDLHVGGEAEE
jgi:DeoR family glycerol-3-phosphate regulon repressor